MIASSPRAKFDQQLNELNNQVLLLGSMAQQAVQQSLDALLNRDQKAAREIFTRDERINEKRYAIENACVFLIATQQPMARDVRVLAAILEIITELERIGDYAKGISKITVLMGDEKPDPVVMHDLSRIAECAQDMLERALVAFMRGDDQAARAISAEDDEVDQLYNQVYWRLIALMVRNQASVELASYLMWAAHNLERMADRVTNICERTVYVATGQTAELDSLDGLNPVLPKKLDS